MFADTRRRLVVAVILLALSIVVFGSFGCSRAATSSPMPATPASGGSAAPMSAMKADPAVQTCSVCGGGKDAVATTGTVVSANGAQVVAVSIKDGTYSPNRFVAKSGVPIDVTFTVVGKTAKGCIATPTFKSLNTSTTVTTGTKTVSLGSLPPGVYEFTCKMGMNPGRIVVQ